MKKTIMLLFCALLPFSAYAQDTRGEQYPEMYNEKPTSIVVMPSINTTNFVEAKEYFYTTLYQPLVEKGYYVFSPYLTMEMFQTESAYDSERFLDGDLSQFRHVLGADAVMFTIIKTWSRNSLSGYLTVGVEFILRSTLTGKTLYSREGTVSVNTSVQSTGGGLFGALVDLAATAISTATTDKIVAGRKCTAYVLSDFPAGRYSPEFEKDKEYKAKENHFKETVR